ncbi:DUF1616 domain-containing protein [Natronorubrum texcoconense]|uniref:Uncharacterized membrane protein n=1 Tax=Natronorubrum texcoconense TaxID=1095776 RepID=A0A1G8XD85_9EURY|nr:DUF1616 domain-containing protein [Natronorubrum texcoconense]SDJ88347.1 Uncharacterized membrane protein [Natronorubrum texcoconense]
MSDNHWWFFDLAAVIAITGAVTFGIFSGVGGVVRTVLLVPLVCFLPGYALVSALFPDEPTDEYQPFDDEETALGNPLIVTGGLESVERVILSVVFSVATVPMVALLASATPRGLTLETVLPGIAVFTVVLSVLAIGSRYRCPADRRFAPSLSSALSFHTPARPNAYSRTNTRPYNVAIVVALVLLVASAGFAIANPPQGDGFTEFAVETETVSGDIDTMYQSTYTAGETDELAVSITNQEHEERDYTTVALLERVGDGDANDSDATVTEAAELDRQSATVAHGDAHEQTLEITPSMQGDDLRLTLLLYDDEPPSEPTAENAYRAIHLPIEAE